MGIIPKVDHPSPAFIHVDIDDLWAIAECYGFEVARDWIHHVSSNSLPRFKKLFHEQGLSATFFLVGRDLESPAYVELIQELLQAGHRVANHSLTHSLRFRALTAAEMAAEIDGCHQMAQRTLGLEMEGFRAPGYAWSVSLMKLLDERGYKYDGSLMPGPYGGVFRWMDSRLRRSLPGDSKGADLRSSSGAGESAKTQYPLFSDTWNSLYPTPLHSARLVEVPSATAPLMRLPFQAGVCMRLGWPYFRACFEPYRWNRALPVVFLFHAADLTDFSSVPYDFFRRSSFFNTPVDERVNLARRFLETIQAHRPIVTTEEWLD